MSIGAFIAELRPGERQRDAQFRNLRCQAARSIGVPFSECSTVAVSGRIPSSRQMRQQPIFPDKGPDSLGQKQPRAVPLVPAEVRRVPFTGLFQPLTS